MVTGVLLPALAMALVVAVVLALLRQGGSGARRRVGGAGAKSGGRERAATGDDVGLRAGALVGEILAAFRKGPNADAAALKRAERIEEQGRHLYHALGALLLLSKGWSRSARAIEPALVALRRGDGAPAVRLLSSLVDAMTSGESRDWVPGAQLLRHLAAVSFLSDPQAALAPARRAAELAPDQPLAWSLLGIVAEELADYELAKDACEMVLKLGAGIGGQGLLAGAVGTLGEIYLAQGDLDRAEEAFRIALTHQAGLAHPENMVRLYRNLAQVEMARGDWGRAAEIVDKALSIETSLGHREGMADLELQAGLIAQRREDLSSAFARWAKARQLFEASGAVEKVEALDRLIARTFKSEKKL